MAFTAWLSFIGFLPNLSDLGSARQFLFFAFAAAVGLGSSGYAYIEDRTARAGSPNKAYAACKSRIERQLGIEEKSDETATEASKTKDGETPPVNGEPAAPPPPPADPQPPST